MLEVLFFDGFNGWRWAPVIQVDENQHVDAGRGATIPLNFTEILKIRVKQ